MKRPLDETLNATAKPLFLTKAQREELALQRRQEEIAQQRRLQDQQLSLHHNPTRPSSDSRDRHRRDRDRERDRDRDREEEAKARERARLEKSMERDKERELDAIKEQYLGSKKPKKRVIKPSEKFRFSFDWENTEDTSRDMNILCQNPHEAQLLFGRGFRAGMDRKEQKKLAAKNEKEMREEIRRKEGVEERPEEAAAQRLKEEAADTYDSFDMRVD